jgi:hypothetical protein
MIEQSGRDAAEPRHAWCGRGVWEAFALGDLYKLDFERFALA